MVDFREFSEFYCRNIDNRQTGANYKLKAKVDRKWQALKAVNKFSLIKPPYNSNSGYETIGHKKIDRVEAVITNKIRFKCLESVAKPVGIRKIKVFKCDTFENNDEI